MTSLRFPIQVDIKFSRSEDFAYVADKAAINSELSG